MARILLGGSVGRRCDNTPEDVKVVRGRLRSLGFDWVNYTDAGDEADFVRTIKLFQAICKGKTEFKSGGGVDGKISKDGFTHKWLAAKNAPGWVKIYGTHGTGWSSTIPGLFKITGTPYLEGNGGFGTTWILDVIKTAGLAYFSGAKPLYPQMWVRDCAATKGGNVKYHGSHETGLDIDLRLPLKPIAGTERNSTWTFLKTKKMRREHLYREAAEEQLRVLAAQPLVKEIGFEDDTAPRGTKRLHRKWAKVHAWSDHEHHFHVRINPPPMIAGQIT